MLQKAQHYHCLLRDGQYAQRVIRVPPLMCELNEWLLKAYVWNMVLAMLDKNRLLPSFLKTQRQFCGFYIPFQHPFSNKILKIIIDVY